MSEPEKRGDISYAIYSVQLGFSIVSLKLKRFDVLASIFSTKKLFTEASMSIGRKDANWFELISVLALVTAKLLLAITFKRCLNLKKNDKLEIRN